MRIKYIAILLGLLFANNSVFADVQPHKASTEASTPTTRRPSAFHPAPPGVPLSSKTTDAARYWSPEVKELIDSIIAIGSTRVRSIDEISDEALEKRLRIEFEGPLTDPTILLGALYMRKVKTLPWLATDAGRLTRSKPDSYNNAVAGFNLFLRFDPLRYCLNPYEFAIYLGQPFRFMPIPVLDRLNNELPGPFLYEWGMFNIFEEGKGHRLGPMQPRNTSIRLYATEECVASIVLFKAFYGK